MRSSYLKKIFQENPDVAQRYMTKLTTINNVDPFTLRTADLDYSINGIPPVAFPDIFSYLVLTHGFYTHEQMKDYKNLDSHKLFSNGFVLKVGTKVLNGSHVMVGKVKDSQRVNSNPLEAWCIITKDGSVSNSHCTCLADDKEVCNHISALLFAADYANQHKGPRTDIDALWPTPSVSTHVPIPIAKMDFGLSDAPTDKIDVPPINREEVVNLLKRVESLNQTAAIMRIVEPFASNLQARRAQATEESDVGTSLQQVGGSKRNADELNTPPSCEGLAKKTKSLSSEPSHEEVESVALVHEDWPERVLSKKDLFAVEGAVTEEMDKIQTGQPCPRFNSVEFNRQGAIVTSCVGSFSKDWLQGNLSKLELPTGLRLKMIEMKDLFRLTKEFT